MNAVSQVVALSQRNEAIVVDGLTRRFGNGPAVLDQLNLAIAPGEFVALLGRSGSGKSTLLRTLAGLDPVTEGSVIRPRDVSVVFQESRLLPWKRVWQNTVLGLPGANQRAHALSVLEEVGLGHRVDAWPLTLSGGEAQRAALARALVREPAFLMLDEPFAALDALTRLKMQKLISELWGRHRCSVLLVTHDVDEALMLADRAVVMEHGQIHTDLPIPMDRPRRHTDPRFEHLRRVLLESLGVYDD
ncbi:aliphatic sulfonates import ATP-binding protein SsuB [Gluconacetobacter liquefaciens]|uniref:ABC transporter ATP-binding protein n=1 Tax=Gluconacetobacter liquefaciens TaxID=89584 RepID=A0A370FXL4_GLULI|nr:ABC transporter ATP-binding protein [Gluconacetobacter liquefaciens]MBB2187889.1 ABC transporter ATP-binding protein [Gluconacetobacter liquefaciens]RDI34227.1 sulfonate transport system ATP-binding protein [Gluconacetobacter liquefaciens]GBQ98638.1 aliphatic sulfonate ABC transporter ATP-binding protein [Gluconacetobacter liquefaciens NRIC 0522]GEB38810.1 aliphatic sulfonates import ATP-binding protein SsuB [Gluconacetobacter liquefaciens]